MSEPLGIRNTGAFCYFNALMQALYSLDIIRQCSNTPFVKMINKLIEITKNDGSATEIRNKIDDYIKDIHQPGGSDPFTLYSGKFTLFRDDTLIKCNKKEYYIDDNLKDILSGNILEFKNNLFDKLKKNPKYISNIIDVLILRVSFSATDIDKLKSSKCYSIDEWSPFREFITLCISAVEKRQPIYRNENGVRKFVRYADAYSTLDNPIAITLPEKDSFTKLEAGEWKIEQTTRRIGYTGKVVCLVVNEYVDCNQEIKENISILNLLTNERREYELKSICLRWRGHHTCIGKRNDNYYHFNDAGVSKVKPPFKIMFEKASSPLESNKIARLIFYELKPRIHIKSTE